MAFDKTQPTNTTKIRNLGTVIRPNWQAIEEGGVSFKPYATNFANRTPLAVPNDPPAIANTFILYCKQDSTGLPQLYGCDQTGRILQISSRLTPNNVANGYTWLPGDLLMQWGKVSVPSGTSGNITFPLAFAAVPYNVQITIIRSAGAGSNSIYVLDASVTATRFKTENTGSGAHDIYYMAIGPKA